MAITSIIFALSIQSGGAAGFTLTDLGITQYQYYGGGLDINNSGVVVGTQAYEPQFNLGDRAVVWTPGGGVEELPTLGGEWSISLGINDVGQVVGYSQVSQSSTSDAYHGFVWSSTEGMIDVGTLGSRGSRVEDINNSGLAVGTDQLGTGRAFTWTESDGPTGFDGLLGDPNGARAFAVNEAGQVVGSSDGVGAYGQHAFVWSEANGITDLSSAYSEALDINNAGMIVGRSNGSNFGRSQPEAVVWNPSGTMTAIGPGFAYGVNETGQVVGKRNVSRPGPNLIGGFLWEEGIGLQHLRLLDASAGFIYSVDAINDSGQMVGWLSTGSILHTAVLLTPTSDAANADVITSLLWPDPDNPDSDWDGIPDDEDACPDSIGVDGTVIIGECDSGVENVLFEDGCTMADLIQEISDLSATTKEFVAGTRDLTKAWKKQGLISGKEASRINRCARQSS